MVAPPVALVDDDEAKRYVLTRRLRALGVAALELGSAAEALAQVGPEPLAWVIDVRLPDRDGLALCAALRAAGRRAPIFLHSALLAEPELRARALAAGATATFTDQETEGLLEAVGGLAARPAN